MLLADFFVLLRKIIALPPPVEICLFSWYSWGFPSARRISCKEAFIGREALKGLKRKKTSGIDKTDLQRSHKNSSQRTKYERFDN